MSFDDYANLKVIAQNVRLDTVHAGEQGGRTVDVGLWTGQTVFRNGEVAITSGVESSDGRDGALSFHGNLISVLKDGATFRISYDGKTRVKAGTNQFISEGAWTFTSGTGRLAGIEGGGTFKAEGAGDKWFSDAIGKAKKA